jgi:mono/diheme cytochrome c family protein
MRKFSSFLSLAMVLVLVGTFLCGCDYARMREDDALEYYDMKFPDMPAGVVPLGGGAEPAFAVAPDQVRNPLQPVSAVIEEGELAYTYFCIQCHGPDAKGFGTVGQSFAPLPTDLRGDYVRSQTDGELFLKIGNGFKRHPPLAHTVSVHDRWALLAYIRALEPEVRDQPPSRRSGAMACREGGRSEIGK